MSTVQSLEALMMVTKAKELKLKLILFLFFSFKKLIILILYIICIIDNIEDPSSNSCK